MNVKNIDKKPKMGESWKMKVVDGKLEKTRNKDKFNINSFGKSGEIKTYETEWKTYKPCIAFKVCITVPKSIDSKLRDSESNNYNYLKITKHYDSDGNGVSFKYEFGKFDDVDIERTHVYRSVYDPEIGEEIRVIAFTRYNFDFTNLIILKTEEAIIEHNNKE